MRSRTKKNILNIIMAAAIIAFLASGVLIVGNLKGWFEDKTVVAMMQYNGIAPIKQIEIISNNKIGSVNIERGGAVYSLKDGNRLKDKDIIETLNGSSIEIVFGESVVCLDENSNAVLNISKDTGNVTLTLNKGGVFANISEPFTLNLMNTDILQQSGVFAASAPYGSGRVHVLENTVTVGTLEVKAGNAVNLLSKEIYTEELTIESLNSFELSRLMLCDSTTLCFTTNEIQRLNSEREIATHETIQAQLLEDQNSNKAKEDNADKDNDNDDKSNHICTITIRCDTVLDNMEDLSEGKNKYVPKNGCILAASKLTFRDGETVFDALKKACTLAGIPLEYSWTPMYDSYYVEGINNLYEFDCGDESGWIYKVNDWFPNYGCSGYKLTDGDKIVWYYTCRGLGEDVAGSVY